MPGNWYFGVPQAGLAVSIDNGGLDFISSAVPRPDMAWLFTAGLLTLAGSARSREERSAAGWPGGPEATTGLAARYSTP